MHSIINGFWEESWDFNVNAGFFCICEQQVQINGELIRLEAGGDHPACELIGQWEEIPHSIAEKYGLKIEE